MGDGTVRYSLPLEGVPTWVLAALVVVGVAQVAFELWALIDMLRRPSDQLTLGGRKWLWAVIILLVNWIGAIVYVAAGRKPAPAADEAPSSPAGERSDAAMDALYGKREGDGS